MTEEILTGTLHGAHGARSHQEHSARLSSEEGGGDL